MAKSFLHIFSNLFLSTTTTLQFFNSSNTHSLNLNNFGLSRNFLSDTPLHSRYKPVVKPYFCKGQQYDNCDDRS